MKWYGLLVMLALFSMACEDPKPPLSGRLRGPSAVAVYKGCPQKNQGCEYADRHHLLLVANSLSDDIRIFDVEESAFFEAPNPLFPFLIPVGLFPRSIAVEPHGEYAFVVNQLSDDVSIIDLSPTKLVEIDTDDAPTSLNAPSLKCDDYPDSDRCVAGVTRLPLADFSQAEDIALPAGTLKVPGMELKEGAAEPWNRDKPLPVFVSLPGVGKVQRFDIKLPADSGQGKPFVLSDETIDVGGIPSGLAINKAGTMLFVANEESDQITAYDIEQGILTTIEVGGPSRKVYLTPDETVVYVFRSDESRIVLVDAVNLVRINAGLEELTTARNPLEFVEEGEYRDIVLSGLPQSLVFVTGRSVNVAYRDFSRVAYTEGYKHPEGSTYTDENGDEQVEEAGEVVLDIAYVSNLDGSIYFIDAKNHHGIDEQGHSGATAKANGFRTDADSVVLKGLYDEATDPENCVDFPTKCKYPIIAGFKNESATGVEIVDGKATSETFSLTWEGIIPNTTYGTGRFFNNAGLRLIDQKASGLESAGLREGDLLELITIIDPACSPVGESSVPRFYILGQPEFDVDGNKNSLPIAAVAAKVEDENEEVGVERLASMDLAICWQELVRYRIRARQAWVVEGTSSGQLPRIEESMMRNVGEEILEPTYSNELFALTMLRPADPGAGLLTRDSAWYFTTTSGYFPARFSPSISIASSGDMVVVDYEDGEPAKKEPTEDDPSTLEEIPKDDRVFLLFETSDAFMEISNENFSNRLWQ